MCRTNAISLSLSSELISNSVTKTNEIQDLSKETCEDQTGAFGGSPDGKYTGEVSCHFTKGKNGKCKERKDCKHYKEVSKFVSIEKGKTFPFNTQSVRAFKPSQNFLEPNNTPPSPRYSSRFSKIKGTDLTNIVAQSWQNYGNRLVPLLFHLKTRLRIPCRVGPLSYGKTILDIVLVPEDQSVGSHEVKG